MSETILSQFKNNGVPATGLTPKITIRIEDGTVVINAEDMSEIDNGRYSYLFSDYDKKKTYLIDTDGGSTLDDSDRYQSTTNILDAYPNKKDWKGSGGGTINNNVDTKQLAKDVWLEKEKNYEGKEGTMGAKLVGLNTNIINEKIDNIEIPNNKEEIDILNKKSDNIIELQSEIISSIDKQGETLVGMVSKTVDSIDELENGLYTRLDEISIKIDDVFNKIEGVDYDLIEKSIVKNKIDIVPIINELKTINFSLKDEIRISNELSIKSLSTLTEKQILENTQNSKCINNVSGVLLELGKSIGEIKNNINILSEKEIDFSFIIDEFVKISHKIEEGGKKSEHFDEKTKKLIEEKYKNSIKYIIYIAKNLNNINKSELNEIKKYLLTLKN